MIKPFLLSLLIPALASGATIASFTPLGSHDGTLAYAWGISADGSTIVGGVGSQAFRWTAAEGFELLDRTAGGFLSSMALDVSGDGSVVTGLAYLALGERVVQQAFRWTVGTGMVSLGSLDGSDDVSGGWAISHDGSIIFGDSPHEEEDRDRAMRWNALEGMVSLGNLPGGDHSSGALDVSADGLVGVGSVSSAAGGQAFRWTALDGMVGLGDLQTAPAPGAIKSNGSAISGDGTVIVGSARSDTAAREAYRWTAATGMVGLGDIPGGFFDSGGHAASHDGSVIVGQGSGPAGQQAFIWDSEHGIRDLREVLMTEYGLASTLADWQLLNAQGISADGKTIFGSGSFQNQIVGAWVVTIPEPATIGLLLVGSIALSIRRARART